MSFRRAKPSNYCTLSRIDRRDPNDTVCEGLKKAKVGTTLRLFWVCVMIVLLIAKRWLRNEPMSLRKFNICFSEERLILPWILPYETSGVRNRTFALGGITQFSFPKARKEIVETLLTTCWILTNHCSIPGPYSQYIRHFCRNAHSVMKHKEPTGAWDSVFNIQNLFGYFSGYRAQKKSRVYGKLTRDLNT